MTADNVIYPYIPVLVLLMIIIAFLTWIVAKLLEKHHDAG